MAKKAKTAKAVKKQFLEHRIMLCLELHTYSSLDPNFIAQYAHTLDHADEALIFYDPEALRIKNREPIATERILQAFALPTLKVFTDGKALSDYVMLTYTVHAHRLLGCSDCCSLATHIRLTGSMPRYKPFQASALLNMDSYYHI